MKFYAEINTANKIIPIYDSDYDVFKRVKKNVPLSFEVKQERNYKFLKKFFALMNMLFQNQELYKNIDDLREDLTIDAGYFETRVNLYGEEIKKAKSISFSKMDETEFNKYYEDVLNQIVKHFNFEKQEIIDNVNQFY